MIHFNVNDLAWEKMNGLLPTIVQDAQTSDVLMLAYMNQEALEKTIATNWVTFYSRSKNKLWMKGETSNNKLKLFDIFTDCDKDTLLVLADPTGPICHTGSQTCFGNEIKTDWEFIQQLEAIIANRKNSPSEKSYTTSLFHAGISKIAQKVGEEAVEVALAAVGGDADETCSEAADLLFHLMVLLKAKDLNLSQVIKTLRERSENCVRIG